MAFPYGFSAQRARVLAGFDPLFDALSVEVVLWVARQRRHLVIALELCPANGALVLACELGWVEPRVLQALDHLRDRLLADAARKEPLLPPQIPERTGEAADHEEVHEHLEVTNDEDHEHQVVEHPRAFICAAVIGAREKEEVAVDEPEDVEAVDEHEACYLVAETEPKAVSRHVELEQIVQASEAHDEDVGEAPVEDGDSAPGLASEVHDHHQKNGVEHQVGVGISFDVDDFFIRELLPQFFEILRLPNSRSVSWSLVEQGLVQF